MTFKQSEIIFLSSYLLLPKVLTSDCLIKEEPKDIRHLSIKYSFQNCSDNSYCCDDGCCSVLWYTGPLAIFLVVIFICCLTCIKACWDVYSENITNDFDTRVVRYQPNRNNTQISTTSPPPAYNVAIFLPQPRDNRIPSYEEVVNTFN